VSNLNIGSLVCEGESGVNIGYVLEYVVNWIDDYVDENRKIGANLGKDEEAFTFGANAGLMAVRGLISKIMQENQ